MNAEHKQEILKNLEDYEHTLSLKKVDLEERLSRTRLQITMIKGELAAPANE